MQYDFIGFIVAIVVATGGAIGYFTKGSIPSIVAGVTFGLLIAIGAYYNSRTPPKPLFELIILLVLAAFMGYRWYRSEERHFMPSGLVTLVAFGAFVINTIIYFDDLRNQF